jgi:sulfate permease, SulP family
MKDSHSASGPLGWLGSVRPARWVPEYRSVWLPSGAIAGITLAAYAIPVSLAYAGLAGLPPQVGLYGYLLGGVGYALFGSSRQLAIGPTSAISLMIAGTVGAMAGGDALRYGEIASLTGFTVAALCLIAWAFQFSVLVKLISDSILVGFKAGAGLTIAMTQLPSLFGVSGGGHNFFERAAHEPSRTFTLDFFPGSRASVSSTLTLIESRVIPLKMLVFMPIF